MRTYLFYTLILFLISSCNHVSDNLSERKITIIPLKEIVFDVGFPTNHNYMYYSMPDSTEYFCFADVNTNKRISMFSFNSTKKYDIPLNEVTNDFENIDNFSIISLDTVIVLSLYTNKLYFLNRNGECWKKIHLDSIVKPVNGDKFEYTSSYDGFLLNTTTLILNCDWRSNKNDVEPENQLAHLKYFYGNTLKAPYFLKISNIFSDSISYDFGLENFYSKFFTEPSETVEGSYYYNLNHRLFCFSKYSDKLFEINIDSLTIKKEVQIKSVHTKIGFLPIPINETTIHHAQDLVNNNYLTQGALCKPLYDKYRNLYYVVVLVTQKTKSEFGRTSSLLVYDENFNKLNEMLLPAEKYEPWHIMVCKEGLLIPDNIKNSKDYDQKKSRFMLFKVIEE